MKAKVFEWVDAGFAVPPALLRDETAWLVVSRALDFANGCAGILSRTFDQHFRRTRKSKSFESLRRGMGDDFWAALAFAFREFVLAIAGPAAREPARQAWAAAIFNSATHAFEAAADAVGDDGRSMSQAESAKKRCAIRLALKRKEYLNEPGEG